MPDELTEAMHREFTVYAETNRHHRLTTARSTVGMGLSAAAKAAEIYSFTVEEIEVLSQEPGK